MPKKLTQEQFISKAIEVHGNKYDYSKVNYINNYTHICITCRIHGDFYIKPRAHINDSQGCSLCAGNKRKTTNAFINELKIIHNLKNYTYEKTVYKNNNTPVIITCAEHGDWKTRPRTILSGHCCPMCVDLSRSIGEGLITEYLNNNSIEYETQKTFSECVHKIALRFDFFLPTHNICIEYNGKQHYEPIEWFGGASAFKETTQRDFIKEEYCKNKGIQLIQIPYTEKNNISNILDSIL